MSFKDWISYVLRRLMWYLETPRNERKEKRRAKKEKWSYRWFGMLPFALKMFLKKQKNRFKW